MSTAPVRLDLSHLPEEGWGTPDRGVLSWKTLFSADRTPTEALTCGVATVPPGGSLTVHRHTHPEVYFGIEGSARVMIEDTFHDLSPGVAIFVPGGALHSVYGGEETARFFYAFAADSFTDVTYEFPANTDGALDTALSA